jgi:hypothetical protein
LGGGRYYNNADDRGTFRVFDVHNLKKRHEQIMGLSGASVVAPNALSLVLSIEKTPEKTFRNPIVQAKEMALDMEIKADLSRKL